MNFDFLKNLAPEVQAALLTGGLGLAGGVIGGIGQGRENEKDRAFNLAQLLQNNQQFAATLQQRMQEGIQQDMLSRQTLGLQATQMDPLAQQKSRANFARQGALLRNARPVSLNFDLAKGTGDLSGGITIPEGGFGEDVLKWYSPESMAAAEGNFAAQAAGVNPYGPAPDLSAFYGEGANRPAQLAQQMSRNQLTQSQGAQQASIDEFKQAAQAQARPQGGPAPEGYEYDKKTGELKKKGSPWWKKIAKVGLAAAPFIAAPFTGGASLSAIGIGAGAASGALDGGLKGALMGGALGAIPGGAAAGGGKAALMQTLRDPRFLMQAAGAGIGGRTGSALQLASMIAPGAPRPPQPRMNNQLSAPAPTAWDVQRQILPSNPAMGGNRGWGNVRFGQ